MLQKVAGGILGAVVANNTRPTNNNYYGNSNNNGYYDNGYERTNTYVNNNYYYNDPYYRPNPQISINYVGGYYDRGIMHLDILLQNIIIKTPWSPTWTS